MERPRRSAVLRSARVWTAEGSRAGTVNDSAPRVRWVNVSSLGTYQRKKKPE